MLKPAMATKTVPITIVVPTVRSTRVMERTLRSIAACERPAGLREVLVVENGPVGDARGIVDSLAGCRYSYVERGNKSAALNHGLQDVDDGLVIFFDDDVTVDRKTLVAFSAAAQETGPGYFYGGPFGVDYEREPPEWLRPYLPGSARGWRMGTQPATIDTPEFLGFNWAAWRQDLSNAGPFSEDRGPGATTGATGQESDMMRRLLALGVRGRYVPDAYVRHFVPAERCSPEWVLSRGWRTGVEKGLLRRGGTMSERIRSWLRWQSYRALYRVRQSASLDPQERFGALYYQRRCEGYLYGAHGVGDPADTGGAVDRAGPMRFEDR